MEKLHDRHRQAAVGRHLVPKVEKGDADVRHAVALATDLFVREDVLAPAVEQHPYRPHEQGGSHVGTGPGSPFNELALLQPST